MNSGLRRLAGLSARLVAVEHHVGDLALVRHRWDYHTPWSTNRIVIPKITTTNVAKAQERLLLNIRMLHESFYRPAV